MHSPKIIAWARSAVTPYGGALSHLHAHDIAAPVVQALLARAGLPPEAVDAVVAGNALGAGGNPARMLAFAAGLRDGCAAFSVDTQCCSGLDAVGMAAGLILSAQASVVVAGGVEAWSRAPLRQVRPLHPGDPAPTYERPAFCPDPERDPDLLESAARYAQSQGLSRAEQDAYALLSHHRAVQHQHDLAAEIVPIAQALHDSYPRALTPERAARMPASIRLPSHDGTPDCSLSPLSISAKADGAAFVLLASAEACTRWGLRPQARWLGQAAEGIDPRTPLLAAEQATRTLLQRHGIPCAQALQAIELHDAFAAQGLGFCRALGIAPEHINRRGGGIARGHPIGASGAVALVRLLADLHNGSLRGARGLAAIAGAGGVGSAVLVERV